MTFKVKLVIINKERKGGRKVRIYEYSENMTPDFSAAVVALGMFDGVHRGHKALLSSAKKEAEKRKAPLVVFTFFSENELPKGVTRLYSSEVKNELLEKAGADAAVYADFNKISGVSAESLPSSPNLKPAASRYSLALATVASKLSLIPFTS